MQRNKKEKTYYGINESLLDEDLIKKIERYSAIVRMSSLIVLICNCLYFLPFMFKRLLGKIGLLICLIICLAVALCALTIEIIYTVKLNHIKKQVKRAKEEKIDFNIEKKEKKIGAWKITDKKI